MKHPRFLLAAATLACLLPWINRAFFVDDPLFLWSAKRILTTPGDFYGGTANWGGTTDRLVDVVMNPPLASYYLAAIAAVTGFHEVPLHLGMLIPAIAAVLGTFQIAQRISQAPLLAGAALIVTPAFLLCSISLMCDISMLALWLWSLALWLRGIEDHELWPLVAAAFLMGLCGLTKYFGVSLLPLAFVYACARRRRLGWWVLCLMIPLGMFAAFEWYSHAQYGRYLMWEAAGFARIGAAEQKLTWFDRGLFSLVYAGAGLASLAFWMPWLWSWRANIAWIAGTLGLGAWLIWKETIGQEPLRSPDGIRWSLVIHLTLFAAIGVQMMALMLSDLWRRRDATALLLSLWVVGTFVFAAWLNWTVNGRTILPLAPAVAILVARRIDSFSVAPLSLPKLRLGWGSALAASYALSMALCWADYSTAKCEKEAALALAEKYGASRGTNTLWFEGHWGFQYYLMELGAYCVDYHGSAIEPIDIVVVQNDNPAVNLIPASWQFIDVLDAPVPSWISTNSMDAGASYYSHVMGPLPYRFGKAPPRRFAVLRTPERYLFTPDTKAG